MLAGGLWQALLVVTSWTVNRGSAERTALATSYAGLAGYAADVAAGRQSPPSPSQLSGSYVLGDPNPLMRTAAREYMLDLAEEAERIRATLTALSLRRKDDVTGPSGRSILDGAARVLTELAGAVSGRPGQRADHLAAARSTLAGASAQAAPAGSGPRRRCSASCAARTGSSSGSTPRSLATAQLAATARSRSGGPGGRTRGSPSARAPARRRRLAGTRCG